MAAPEELRPLYLAAHEAFDEKDYAAAVQACDQILAQAPGEDDARKARTIAAILDGDYAAALAVSGDEEALDLERAYALYQLGRGEEALAVLAPGAGRGEEACLHLKGQTLFKLGRYAEAADTFAALAEQLEEAEGDPELVTNVYASFVAAGKGREALDRFPVDEATMEGCYELAFIKGAALIDAEEWEAAETRLKEAQGICKRLGEEEQLDAQGQLNEAAAIHLELAYVLAARGKRSEAFEHLTTLIHKAAKLTDPVVAVLAVNNAAALKADAPGGKGKGPRAGKGGEQQLAETAEKLKSGMEAAAAKLMPKQRLLLTLNRTLLAMRGGNVHAEEAEAVLSSLSDEEQASWRVAMARIALKMTRDPAFAPEEELKVLLAAVQAAGSEEERVEGERSVGTALAQVLVNQGQLQEAAAVLEGLSTLQGYPAHVATVASLHARRGDTKAALAAFDRGINPPTRAGPLLPVDARVKVLQGAASVRSRHGKHAEAAQALKELLDGEATGAELEGEERMKALAALVIATSWFDEEEAEALAAGLPVSALPVFDHLDAIDAEALEAAGLPRTGRRAGSSRAASAAAAVRGMAAVGADAGAPATKKERRRKADPEKQRRKREKARQAHIDKLKAEGRYDPTKKPDPERWIPKSQRSYNKRGRKARGRFVGAQGSGDGAQKDTAKLDVASRVAAQKKKDAEDAEARTAALLAGGRRKKR